MANEPCCICKLPLQGTVMGAGDGYAHPECYWRRRAERAEAAPFEAVLRRRLLALAEEWHRAVGNDSSALAVYRRCANLLTEYLGHAGG